MVNSDIFIEQVIEISYVYSRNYCKIEFFMVVMVGLQMSWFSNISSNHVSVIYNMYHITIWLRDVDFVRPGFQQHQKDFNDRAALYELYNYVARYNAEVGFIGWHQVEGI